MDKHTKYKIAFDNSNPTYGETKQSILDLIRVLQKLQVNSVQDSKDILEEEKTEIVLNTIRENQRVLETIDEHFDTIFPKVAKKYNRKKPKKNDKD